MFDGRSSAKRTGPPVDLVRQSGSSSCQQSISNVTLAIPQRHSVVRLTQFMVELTGAAQRK